MSVPPPVEKLTLAYRDLFEIDPRIVQQFGPTLKELDLSNNNLRYTSTRLCHTAYFTHFECGNNTEFSIRQNIPHFHMYTQNKEEKNNARYLSV